MHCFLLRGEILLEVTEVQLLTRSSAAMQICSACTISLTDRLLLGMAFPKQLSFRCLIKQLAEKFDLITKITRKSIHHTTPLKKHVSFPHVILRPFSCGPHFLCCSRCWCLYSSGANHFDQKGPVILVFKN